MKKLNLKDKIRKKKDEGIVKRKVRNEENDRPKKKFRFWYWFLVVIMFFAILVFVAGVGFCYYIVKSAPEFDAQRMFEKEATRVLDSKGNLIASSELNKDKKLVMMGFLKYL